MRAFVALLLMAVCAPLPAARFPPAPSELTAADSVQLAWVVKIPMRDGVRLNATVYTPGEQQAPAAIATARWRCGEARQPPASRRGTHQFDLREKNYNSGGVVQSESMADARPVTVSLYHDREHPSTLYIPLGRVPAADEPAAPASAFSTLQQ